VVVAGHSDDLGASGRNLRLSKSRAEAVVQALVERGVAHDRLRAEGFGPDRPLFPNDSQQHREQNRRVELRIERQEP
jgi:outer membrane protein OmpA-like peptidoglycan-associated protein